MAISVRKRLETFFAPAEREPIDRECPVHRRLAAEPMLQTMLDAFPGPAMILNEQRQAVLVNGKITELLSIPAAELLGLRPGEMLDCIHWRQHPWGCGTTVFCRTCGAVRAILESQQREAPDVQECQILRDLDAETSALNLRVWATPIRIDGDPFTIFVFHRRVTGNLIQNALEACSPGDTVTVTFHNDGQPAFSVHNESVMTEDVSLQLFERSFSTKVGTGHGIGTYSVKLLTERYLSGTVDFASPAPRRRNHIPPQTSSHLNT